MTKSATQQQAATPISTATLMNPDDDIDEDEYVFRMATAQAMQFKMLFDVLKDLLTEVNFHFDQRGFRVISLDPGKIGMVHLRINHVEHYVYNGGENETHVGLLVPYLYKILRHINTCYHIELALRKDDLTKLLVTLYNPDKRLRTTHRVNVLKLDVEDIIIPAVEFDHVVSMPSTDLQRYIKELNHVSNVVNVRVQGRTVYLIARGDQGETNIEVVPTPGGLNWIRRGQDNPPMSYAPTGASSPPRAVDSKEDEEEEETSSPSSKRLKTGEECENQTADDKTTAACACACCLSADDSFESAYFTRFLERFTKSQVDSRVQVYLRRNYPIILRYEIAIGSLVFAVSPIVNSEQLRDK